jgi:putative membrane protein
LALLAGAVALVSLVPDIGPRPIRIALVVVLLALSTMVTIGAYFRWDRTERALREGRTLPVGLLPRIVASGLAIVVTGVVVLVILAETGRR